MHSPVFGTNTLPSLHAQFGNEPSMPVIVCKQIITEKKVNHENNNTFLMKSIFKVFQSKSIQNLNYYLKHEMIKSQLSLKT